jgi:hypothetical protein
MEKKMERNTKAGLAYIEEEIARCERRIKRIRENPDPSKPKSNILLYEMEREFRIEQKEAYKSGKPIGYAGVTPLTRALGMVPWDAIMAADRTYGEAATRYFEVIRKEGMPEHTCDRCSVLIPMVMSGDFPRPDFLVTSNFECLPIFLTQVLITQLMDIPSYNIDRHFHNYKGELDDEGLQYVTDQLGELIEYVEANVPGCKYDEDLLIELQEYDRQFLQQYQKLWKLKAAIPCPLSGRETFREFRRADIYTDPRKAVEYMRLYVEEVEERVEKGLGAAQPEERLRLLWSVAGPFYADPFSWLEKRGVSIPAAEMTVYNGWYSGREAIWGDPWKGRKLTPLEEEARQLDFTWGRLGEHWVRTHMNSCQDLHLDGIVYFLQWGCPTSNNLGKVIAEVAEKELGIPTLLIEGRMLETSVFDEKDFYAKLSDFLEICLSRKESRTLNKAS